MIRYMLDTKICIDLIRCKSPLLLSKLNEYDPDEVSISAIVFAELQAGVSKSSNPARNLERLTDFCTPLSILPFDSEVAEQYGLLRAHLERAGVSIGPLDLLIASHALALDCTLITNNTGEFQRAPGLRLEAWRF